MVKYPTAILTYSKKVPTNAKKSIGTELTYITDAIGRYISLSAF